MKFIFYITLLLLANCIIGQGTPSAIHWDRSNYLKDNTIYDICQTASGKVYIGHDKGMSIFYGVRMESPMGLKRANAVSNFTPIAPNKFICRGFQGNCFLIANDTLLPLENINQINGGYPTFYKTDYGVFGVQFNKLFKVDENGGFSMVSFGNLKIDRLNHSFEFKNKIYANALINSQSYKLIIDLKTLKIEKKWLDLNSSFTTYFSNNKSVFDFNHKTKSVMVLKNNSWEFYSSFVNFIPDDLKITKLTALNNGKVLIGSFDGLYILDSALNFISREFNSYQISALMEDQEGNLWVGTLRDGIFIVPNLINRTVSLNFEINKNTKVADAIVGRNGLILGTFDGNLIFLSQSGKIEKILNLGQKSEVQSMFFDSIENEVIVFSDNLYFVDATTRTIKRSKNVLSTKCIDKYEDIIALGTSSGLYYDVSDKQAKMLDSFWIQRLAFINKNELLLQTRVGLLHFFVKENKYQLVNINKGIFPSNLIKYKGKQYFSVGNKVYIYEKNIPQLVFENTNGIIEKIIADYASLYVIDEKEKVKCIAGKNMAHVYQNLLYLDNQVLYLNNVGDVFFGTALSEVHLFKQQEPKKFIRPNISIFNLKGTYIFKDNWYISNFEDNELVVAYTFTPNISIGNQSVLKYRLTGYHKNWKTLSQKESYTLTLSRLPFGSYNLEAFIEGPTGLKSAKSIIAIKVKPPYYLRWWFIALAIFVLLMLLFIFLNIYQKRIKNRNKEELEKEKLKWLAVESELKAIRAQMNPHFIFNSLSSIQKNILNNENINAYRNLSTFAKLLRQSIEYTKDEYHTIEKEIDFLNNYISLEQVRCNYAFDYSITISEEVAPRKWLIPSLICQPFVENAIIHGLLPSDKKKDLIISVFLVNNNSLIFKITDNGVGINHKQREKTHKHSSFALKAMNDRIALINKNKVLNIAMQLESSAAGTTVELKIQQQKQ